MTLHVKEKEKRKKEKEGEKKERKKGNTKLSVHVVPINKISKKTI